VVLEAVVVRQSGVLVFLAGRRNDITDKLDAAWHAAFEDWAKQRRSARERGDQPPPPPEQPGVILKDLQLVIRDDAGTAYQWAGTSFGGTGSEWEAWWRFHPSVPCAAHTLTVAIDSDDRRERPYTVAL